MRIVTRRYLATLLALWMVVAVGLVAQAASVSQSNPTINTSCPQTPCRVGVSVYVYGEGLVVKTAADFDRYWIQIQFEPDQGYQRAFVNPDGSYFTWLNFDQPGDHPICLTYFKQSGQILTLACTTVTLEPSG